MAPFWIDACEKWLHRQGSKCRQIPYYQVSCLLFLAKRINLIRKKFWNEIDALVKQAVLDDPPGTVSVYIKQIKSRIRAPIREFDLQNAAEYELPILSHVLETDIPPPTNVDDDDCGPSSQPLPAKLLTQFTRSSFQVLSTRSWDLLLETSRRLFGAGNPKTLSYDQVLKYMSEINQALDSFPTWNSQDRQVFLSSAYLSCPLREFLLALHRPHLNPSGPNVSLSRTICFQAARDIFLLNTDLAARSLQSLILLREDLLIAALTTTRITLQQPPSILPNSSTTDPEIALGLLDMCHLLTEDRYLRASDGEPRAPIIMLGAILVLKIQLDKESRVAAKRAGAKRFQGRIIGTRRSRVWFKNRIWVKTSV